MRLSGIRDMEKAVLSLKYTLALSQIGKGFEKGTVIKCILRSYSAMFRKMILVTENTWNLKV